MIFFRAFEDGFAHAWAVGDHAGRAARLLADDPDRGDRGAAEHDLRGRLRAASSSASNFRGKALLNALIDLPFAVSPVVDRPRADPRLRRVTAGSATGSLEHGIQVIFSVPGMVLATIFVSLPFVVREVVPVLREIGDEQEQAAPTLGASALADLLADHPALDPLGRRLRRRPRDGSGAGRVRRRGVVSGQDRRPDRDADRCYVEQRVRALRPAGAYAASLVLALMALAHACSR